MASFFVCGPQIRSEGPLDWIAEESVAGSGTLVFYISITL